MHTLRGRLTLSHLLPILIIIPIIGIALVYLLETQVLLANLSSEVEGQGELIAELANDTPLIWKDPNQARDFLVDLGPALNSRVSLLDNRGKMLASSDTSDNLLRGIVPGLPGLSQALNGQKQATLTYNQGMKADVVDVLVPVTSPDGSVEGVVRITHQVATIHERFQRLRILVGAVLVAGLILGGLLGLFLALDLEQPLRRLDEAMRRISSGERLSPLPVGGPTELRQVAITYNTLVERLQTLERARRQLLANLVHEIGRPLGAMYSAIQALQRGADKDPELQKELLAGMVSEVGLLQRLLEDLSGLYDKVLGILELDPRPIPISDWLPSILITWRELALEKRLHWYTDIPANLPIMRLDPDRIAQAVGNLISNAIKYSPPGSQVGVSTSLQDCAPPEMAANAAHPCLLICVSDSGPGIPAVERDLIFRPFYRGKQTSRFLQGMGLGLSIARDLVEAHGGQLKVDSQPGRGSQFMIWLPV